MRSQRSAIPLLLLGAGLFAALQGTDVAAQVYKYRDPSTGRVIMTDKPPAGADVRRRAAPSAAPAEAEEADGNESGDKPAKVPPKVRESGVDPRLEARRKEEEARRQAEQRSRDEAERERLREACADMRRNLAALESGQRIARMNDAGEREFLSDEQRARDIERARADLERCSE
jgi:hypothetical protein